MKNKTYVLKNAVILDGTANMQPITGKKLLIENGIIADILPDDADTGSAEVIDLNGKYLMPGLINLHVHLPGSGMPKHTKKQNAESVRRLMSFAPSRAVVCTLFAAALQRLSCSPASPRSAPSAVSETSTAGSGMR